MLNISLFKSERFRRLSKEGLWIILGQLGAVIGALLGVRLLTKFLSPTAYGELALGMTIAMLVNQVVLAPLINGAMRFYAPAVEQSALSDYLAAVRRLVLSATGIVFCLMFLVVVLLAIAGLTKWILISILALIFAILSGYNAILAGMQGAARQRSIVALHQGIEPWVRFLLTVALLLWLGATSTVAMFGYSISIIVVLSSQYIFFKRTVSRHITAGNRYEDWHGKILKFSWPFAAWGIFSWAQQSSDRWALQYFATTKEVGLYAVLFQLGYYPILMATGMVMQLLTPILFQRAGEATDSIRNAHVTKLVWRIAVLSLGMTGLAFFVAFILHVQIFQIFVGKKEYATISYLLPWVVLGGGLFAAAQALTLNLTCQMRTHTMAAVKIITALLGIAFNFIGAYLLGIAGIVFASVVSAAIYFTWMILLFTQKVPVCSFKTEELHAI